MRLTSLFLLALLGCSSPSSYPLTQASPGEEAFVALRQRVAELEAETALAQPASEEVEGAVVQSYVRKNGCVVERVTKLLPVSFERFLVAVPPRRWGPLLADHLGGEVRELPGKPPRQFERMVMDTTGTDLDMTKVEELHYRRDAAGKLLEVRILWDVVHSDNGSVREDVGSLCFAREGAKTQVTFHSAHALATFPFDSWWIPNALSRSILAGQLVTFFRRMIEGYERRARSLSAGEPKAR